MRPSENLRIAYDPRIPAALQAFEFVIDTPPEGQYAIWYLNDQKLDAPSEANKLLWNVVRVKYTLRVELHENNGALTSSDSVHFVVR